MIDWTEQASAQLNQVFDHIALTNSEEIAARITAKVITSVERLESFPMAGRPGRVRGSRELVVPNTPFIVAYALEKDRIVILALYHGAQKWPGSF